MGYIISYSQKKQYVVQKINPSQKSNCNLYCLKIQRKNKKR